MRHSSAQRPLLSSPRSIRAAALCFAALAVTIASLDVNAAIAGDPTIAVDADVAVAGIQPSADYPAYASAVSVDIVVRDAAPSGAFEFDLLFDPAEMQFLGWTEGAFLGGTGRATSCYAIEHEMDLRVGCSSDGPPPPAGASGDGVLATLRFRPKGAGESCLTLLLVETASVDGEPIPTSREDGCVVFSPDSDGDGCANMLEAGDDPALGGGRDPSNYWDFFDVTGDRVIDLSDTLMILEHFGHGPADDAFDGRLDRYLPNPAQPHRTARAVTPSTGIDLIDALVNLLSFGDSCAAT